MVHKRKPSFEFRNQISPRYIEPIFLQLEYDRWYSNQQLIRLLRSGGNEVEGNHIVRSNVLAWSHIGLGERKKTNGNVQNIFRLSALGKQFIDFYSTNAGLFYDLMHFLFYSTYQRSGDIQKVRFWLYSRVCDTLWQDAPSSINGPLLTNRLQVESHADFPEYSPSFSDRAIHGIGSWLQVLTPPFLLKPNINQLYSTRRKYCTPQLFHLATDLIYTTKEGLQYGTSLSVTEQLIEDICKVCLLDTASFWEMADLTILAVNGFEIRRGQWGTSISLEGPPTWITLPDYSHEKVEGDTQDDIEAESET